MKHCDIFILAAGIGSRLRPLTNDLPKSLIDVGSENLIGRLIRQFSENENVNSINVATGYKSNLIEKFINDKYPRVNIVYNKDYDSTNNMYSLMLCEKNMSDKNDVVIVNADCIYDDEIIKICLNQIKSTILIDSSFESDESMKVSVRDNTVNSMSKKLTYSSNTFTSIDLYKLSEPHGQKLFDIINKYISEGQYNKWTEVALNDLCKLKNVEMITADIKGLKWYEIDTISDLNKANILFSNS